MQVWRNKRMMDEDPGVKAAVFVYEVHACRSFPGAWFAKAERDSIAIL
jgi:hypothetical protein